MQYLRRKFLGCAICLLSEITEKKQHFTTIHWNKQNAGISHNFTVFPLIWIYRFGRVKIELSVETWSSLNYCTQNRMAFNGDSIFWFMYPYILLVSPSEICVTYDTKYNIKCRTVFIFTISLMTPPRLLKMLLLLWK